MYSLESMDRFFLGGGGHRQNMQTLHRKAPTLSLQACGTDNYTNLLPQLFGFLFFVFSIP